MPNPSARGADHLDELAFLQGGGEMGALMRAHDWSRSSLGPPRQWPPPLRTVVRLILNTGHPMYIWWGADGACLYNDAYRASIGPERHPGSLGRPAREVWGEIWPIIGPQIEQVLAGRGATWHVNHLVPITRHGRREDVYWTYSYSPIDDESAPHGIGGVLVVCSETTQQVLSAQRAAAERDELERLFVQAPVFMAWLSGPQHRFEIANPAYRTLVDGRDVVGRSVADALPEVTEQGYLALLDQVYATGEPYRADGARVTLRGAQDSVERCVDFLYEPIRGSTGEVTGIFVVGYDVSERVRADEALRASESRHRALSTQLAAANRMKDEFLATLAHELRNPLAPIRSALTLQRLAADRPEVVADARDVMERQLAQLVRLVDDLLDLSRLSRGTVELRRETAELAGILGAAVETSRPLFEAGGHDFVREFPAEPLFVDADPVRLVQVFANLLNNASKFTPRGGRITLAAGREGGEAVVRVRDSGVGLSAEMLPRVFDMFTQADRSHTHVGGGLGIGLTIVQRLVESHGGRVEARSEGPGHGSEFIVWLPLVAAAANAPPDTTAATQPATVHGLRVVIADDNEDAATSLASLLELSGHEVHCVHDGLQALAVARAVRPQAMVLDIAMPGLDGLALGRAIRAEPWGRGVLLIAASGWGQPEDHQRSLDSGFDQHLVKPVDLAALQSLLRPLTGDAGGG
jgi:signal transduction histidine kinase/ActR/RegA family two-component response regulator